MASSELIKSLQKEANQSSPRQVREGAVGWVREGGREGAIGWVREGEL